MDGFLLGYQFEPYFLPDIHSLQKFLPCVLAGVMVPGASVIFAVALLFAVDGTGDGYIYTDPMRFGGPWEAESLLESNWSTAECNCESGAQASFWKVTICF